MLRFELFTEKHSDKLAQMEKWYNDDSIKYKMRPNFKEDDIDEYDFSLYPPKYNESEEDIHLKYLIFLDDFLIGDCSIDFDFPQLYNKEVKSAFIGIAIGESEARGKGVGVDIMKFIEKLCIKRGVYRIELGVFDFNEPAQRLYKKLGYQEVARFERFTYVEGKWHSDIRMEKLLTVK